MQSQSICMHLVLSQLCKGGQQPPGTSLLRFSPLSHKPWSYLSSHKDRLPHLVLCCFSLSWLVLASCWRNEGIPLTQWREAVGSSWACTQHPLSTWGGQEGDRAGLVTSAVSKSVAVAPQPACVADPGGTRHSSPQSGHATSVLWTPVLLAETPGAPKMGEMGMLQGTITNKLKVSVRNKALRTLSPVLW